MCAAGDSKGLDFAPVGPDCYAYIRPFGIWPPNVVARWGNIRRVVAGTVVGAGGEDGVGYEVPEGDSIGLG